MTLYIPQNSVTKTYFSKNGRSDGISFWEFFGGKTNFVFGVFVLKLDYRSQIENPLKEWKDECFFISIFYLDYDVKMHFKYLYFLRVFSWTQKIHVKFGLGALVLCHEKSHLCFKITDFILEGFIFIIFLPIYKLFYSLNVIFC